MVQQRENPVSQGRSRPQRRRDLALKSVVRLVKERTAEDNILYHGVTFHLDPVNLRLIMMAQSRGQRLLIPRPFLAALLRYVLVDHRGQLQSAISFVTFYPLQSSEEAVLKTVISIDGDIIHQVCASCLEDKILALTLSSAHYWLIRQLLGRLTFELTALINRITWGISGGVTTLYLLWDVSALIQGDVLIWGRKVAIACLLPWCSQTILHRGILPRLAPLIRQYMLRRVLQPDPTR